MHPSLKGLIDLCPEVTHSLCLFRKPMTDLRHGVRDGRALEEEEEEEEDDDRCVMVQRSGSGM